MSSVQIDFFHLDTEQNRKALINGTLELLYNDNELQACKKAKVLERLREVLAVNTQTRRFWCTAVAKCATDKERDEKIQAVYTQCRKAVLKNMDRAGSGKLVSLAML
jgi:hypothetical protein